MARRHPIDKLMRHYARGRKAIMRDFPPKVEITGFDVPPRIQLLADELAQFLFDDAARRLSISASALRVRVRGMMINSHTAPTAIELQLEAIPAQETKNPPET